MIYITNILFKYITNAKYNFMPHCNRLYCFFPIFIYFLFYLVALLEGISHIGGIRIEDNDTSGI
jgi:hypothetical protein